MKDDLIKISKLNSNVIFKVKRNGERQEDLEWSWFLNDKTYSWIPQEIKLPPFDESKLK